MKSTCMQSWCCMRSLLKLRLLIWERNRFWGYLSTDFTTTNSKRVIFTAESLLNWCYLVLSCSCSAFYFCGHKHFFQAQNSLLNPFKYKSWKLLLWPIPVWTVPRRGLVVFLKVLSIFVSIIKLKWQAKSAWQENICVCLSSSMLSLITLA